LNAGSIQLKHGGHLSSSPGLVREYWGRLYDRDEPIVELVDPLFDGNAGAKVLESFAIVPNRREAAELTKNALSLIAKAHEIARLNPIV